MRTSARVVLMAIAVGMGTSTSSSWASAVHRSTEQILKELDAIKIPNFDASKKDDRAYTRQFLTRLKGATETRAELILELYKVEPDHERIPTLMAERWCIRPYALTA